MNAEQAKALTAKTAAANRVKEEEYELHQQNERNDQATELFPGLLKEIYLGIESAAKQEDDFAIFDLTKYDCRVELHGMFSTALTHEGYTVKDQAYSGECFDDDPLTILVSWSDKEVEEPNEL